MRNALVAAVVVGIWSAPTAYADPDYQPFLSFLAANNVAVDTNSAIDAARIACAQMDARLTPGAAAAIVKQQVPAVSGAEFWIVAGAQRGYCPE